MRAPQLFVTCFLLISIIHFKAVLLWKRNLRFTGVTSKANPVYMQNLTTKIVDGTLNVDFKLLKTLTFGYRTSIDMQIRLNDSKKYQSLFKFDVDVCEMLSNLHRVSLVMGWYKTAFKYGNLKENCPLDADHYYIRNLVMDASNIPAYLRPGDYRFNVHCFIGKRNSKRETPVADFLMDYKIT